MNNPTHLRWRPGHTVEIARATFYLLLSAAVALDLGRSLGRLAWRPGPAADLCPLDSFSETGTATAVLRQQAEFLYLRARDAAGKAPPSPPDPRREGGDQDSRRRGSLKPLEDLRSAVGELSFDLDEKLLVLYAEDRLDDRVVERYLQFLQEAPDAPQVAGWVRSALECSRRCGRSEEVVDALRRTVRFHPNLRTAKLLALKVQTWEAEQNPGAAGGH